jgi:hypothetical protein
MRSRFKVQSLDLKHQALVPQYLALGKGSSADVRARMRAACERACERACVQTGKAQSRLTGVQIFHARSLQLFLQAVRRRGRSGRRLLILVRVLHQSLAVRQHAVPRLRPHGLHPPRVRPDQDSWASQGRPQYSQHPRPKSQAQSLKKGLQGFC